MDEMRAFVISVNFGSPDYQAHAQEFIMLAKGAGAQIVGTLEAKRDKPDASLFIGSGKVDEAHALMQAADANIVLFDQVLSPAQQRNLERVFQRRVIDRIALILDIFALRARSYEGKLQVELAQLQRLVTRLTRLWTHLERQRGGIGMRGPGESQLEMDKRMINVKVKTLKERLEKVARQRHTQRRARSRSHTLSASLVGYTNAGKSTLFNALTKANTYAADQLFATLDTTSRKIWIQACGNIVLSDTVGFIRDLPTTLVAAFKATLEETVQADLLIHVVDAASEQRNEQIASVNEVLREIHADQIPMILVYNKIDQVNISPSIQLDEHGLPNKVFVSALENEGLDLLREAIAIYAKHLGKYETYETVFEQTAQTEDESATT